MPQIYLLLLALIISSTILIGGSFAQNADNYGLSGYDLEKGPVFYEHGSDAANTFREKRFYDRGAVVEKSYQLPGNSFDGPPKADRQNVNSKVSENGPYYDGRVVNFEVPRRRNYWSEQGARPNQQGLMDLTEADYTRNVDLLNVPGPLDYPVQLNRLANSRFDDYGPRIHLPTARSENQFALPMRERPITLGKFFPENEGTRYAAAGFPETRRPDGQPTFYSERLPEVEGRRVESVGVMREIRPELSRSVSGISSSSLGNSDIIGGGEISRDLEGHPVPVDYWNSQQHPRDRLETIRTYRDRIDSPDRQLSPSDDPYSLRENIFEPRPQIISYVFSKNRSKPSANVIATNERARDKMTDYASRGQEKSRIQDEFGKANNDSKDAAEVTSIQISEIPRHKTRHHHGEGSKRDYTNRRRS